MLTLGQLLLCASHHIAFFSGYCDCALQLVVADVFKGFPLCCILFFCVFCIVVFYTTVCSGSWLKGDVPPCICCRVWRVAVLLLLAVLVCSLLAGWICVPHFGEQ
jgi:hypothetical protein